MHLCSVCVAAQAVDLTASVQNSFKVRFCFIVDENCNNQIEPNVAFFLAVLALELYQQITDTKGCTFSHFS